MKTHLLLAAALVAFAFVPLAEAAMTICSDRIDSKCRSLLCVPVVTRGYVLCTEDLSPVCVTEPCPGLP